MLGFLESPKKRPSIPVEELHIEILKDKILHPERYDHCLNVPSQYDAADYLYNELQGELTAKECRACEKVLRNRKMQL